MGALVAVVSKRNNGNAVLEAVKMLKVLRHRGGETYGISTGSMTAIVKDLSDLADLVRVKSSIAIGYGCSGILPEDAPQPIEYKDCKVAFDGRVFSPQYAGPREIPSLLEQFNDIEVFAENAIRRMNGIFSFAAIKDNRLIVGRDPMGAKPLYLCESQAFFALASEKKALWALGIDNGGIRSFPPGNMAEISGDSVRMRVIKVLDEPIIKAVDEYAALERLYCMLLRSVREKMYGLGEVSIGFSGGLDSSILAALAKKFSVKVLLISVGLEGSKEVEWAEKAANIMGLPLKAETYAPEDVEETLPKVLWLIEEANALKASIFIPIYWVAEISSKLNSRVMLSGQGSDELFAGYHKYLRDFGISPDCVVRATYGDVLRLHENTLEAEEKVCSFHGVDVRFPYVDYELASFALSLPITLKIASQDDPLRKRILRSLAKHIGLPEEIYLKPKRAIQYGTGVNRALKRIAKKKGLSMQSLINKVFSEVRRHENGSSIFA